MNSEKVKEIKNNLKAEISIAENYEFEYRSLKLNCLQDILTLINELESENKNLKWEKQILENKDVLLAKLGEMVQENQKLKDRIAELENEKSKLNIELDKRDCIDYPCRLIEKEHLKQFAERLKEELEEYRLENEYFTEHEPNGNLWQLNASVFCIEVTQDGGLVDETLKEFINETNE